MSICHETSPSGLRIEDIDYIIYHTWASQILFLEGSVYYNRGACIIFQNSIHAFNLHEQHMYVRHTVLLEKAFIIT